MTLNVLAETKCHQTTQKLSLHVATVFLRIKFDITYRAFGCRCSLRQCDAISRWCWRLTRMLTEFLRPATPPFSIGGPSSILHQSLLYDVKNSCFRESLAFATEPVFASLANVLGNHDNMPSPPPKDIAEHKLYDVEIKYGLLQVCHIVVSIASFSLAHWRMDSHSWCYEVICTTVFGAIKWVC